MSIPGTAVTRRHKRNMNGATPIELRPIALPGNFLLPRVNASDGLPQFDDVSQLFLSMLSEFLQIIGVNHDGTETYCKLSQEEWLCVGIETFQDPNLSTYFDRGYRNPDSKIWAVARGLLFPTHSTRYRDNQGWRGVPSFQRCLS